MSLRSVTTTLFRKLLSDPFWPLTCFSWIYYHWMGSSLFVGIIFSAFAIALHLTLWIFCYCQSILVVANNAQTDVSVVTYYCLMVTHTLTIPSLVTVWMIRGRRRVHRFISTILTVDEKLSELGECPSKKSTSRKLLVLSCYPLVLIGMLALYDINLRKVFQASATGGWDELLLLSNYHNLVIVYIESFFAVSALLVGDRYRAVNSALKKMSREYSYDLENVRWFSYNWINTIRDLRTLHRRLFFAAVMISEALGLQMLIITIVDLITIIGDSYNYYLDNVLPCGSTPAGTTEYLIWCIVHTFPICVLAFCCSWTRDQAKYTIVLLQEMSVSNDSLRMEISTFSLQLMHYDLNFTACGFFNIELQFLRIIFGTIATYSVIFIQMGEVPQYCRSSKIDSSVI